MASIGELEELSDIATTRSAFEEIAELLSELEAKSYESLISWAQDRPLPLYYEAPGATNFTHLLTGKAMKHHRPNSVRR